MYVIGVMGVRKKGLLLLKCALVLLLILAAAILLLNALPAVESVTDASVRASSLPAAADVAGQYWYDLLNTVEAAAGL